MKEQQELKTEYHHLGDELQIDMIAISELKPYKKNARTHPKKQIEQISSSINEFGFVNPIIIDDDNGIIAGHGRVEGAKKLGIQQVPSIKIRHLNENQKRAYIIADNKLAENAGWDFSILSDEYKELSLADIEFDLDVTGFELAEIDFMIDQNTSALTSKDKEEDIPELKDTPISKEGDLWQLGEHLLLCGDALKNESYKQLMGDIRAQMIITDPPYNVPIDKHVCGSGSIKHNEFIMASGEMSSVEFTNFLKAAFNNMQQHSSNGSIHFIFMDWRHMKEVLDAGSNYSELKNLCIWNKNNGGMGSLYRSKHEMVFVFKNGNAKHINNVELGVHGRYRTNVWDYAGINTFREGRMEELKIHPTCKPVSMIKDAIMDCSNRGDIILDPFGGSGSTLIAAEQSGRIARLIELDPKYIDCIIERYQRLTGNEVIHTKTKKTYSQLIKERNPK